MRNENANKKQVASSNDNKTRKGDTSRTSSQGRKESSGGERNTNNKGHKKEGEERM